MAFLLYLVVIAVVNNHCTARPVDDNTNSVENGRQTFKFPTIVKPGLELKIEGILEKDDSQFEVILPNKKDAQIADCTLVFDIQKNDEITVTNSIDDYISNAPYSYNDSNTEIKFDLVIIPRVVENGHLFSFNFRTNNDGVSELLDCPVKDYNNVDSVVFKKGVKTFTSLNLNFLKVYEENKK